MAGSVAWLDHYSADAPRGKDSPDGYAALAHSTADTAQISAVVDVPAGTGMLLTTVPSSMSAVVATTPSSMPLNTPPHVIPRRVIPASPTMQKAGSTPSCGPSAIAPSQAVVLFVPAVLPMQPLVPVAMRMQMASDMHVSCGRPPFGEQHRFHEEVDKTGILSPDRRMFKKVSFAGRLSVITEDRVRHAGIQHYAMQFVGGELSNADGVGFILAAKLPCCKNIQRIVAVFANRTGRICVRGHAELFRSEVWVRPLEVGCWVGVSINLDTMTAEFTVWSVGADSPSRATLEFGRTLNMLRDKIPTLPMVSCGYFGCVLKNAGVTVRLGS